MRMQKGGNIDVYICVYFYYCLYFGGNKYQTNKNCVSSHLLLILRGTFTYFMKNIDQIGKSTHKK